METKFVNDKSQDHQDVFVQESLEARYTHRTHVTKAKNPPQRFLSIAVLHHISPFDPTENDN